MKNILLLITAISCTAFAQITITSGDVANMFAVGNSTTIHEDSLQSSVDIGSPGGGNNWNFQTLQSNLSADLTSVDPATTPYIGDFPGANICTHNVTTVGSDTSDIWLYSTINGNYDNLGSALTITAVPGFVTTIMNDPYRRTYEHPMTFNTQWSQTYTQTILINATPINSTSVSISFNVDAYGTMTVPGGASYDALRIRESLTVSGFTSITYSFIALNGTTVGVFATDSNPPNSGVISADGTSYSGALTTTDVEQISGLPEDYSLSQNYPNPFNPSTNIEYSIPSGSFVELKVYDILGNEVASLVNEQQQAGVYRADFTGENLPSGMYFARITANEFTQVVKMTLLK